MLFFTPKSQARLVCGRSWSTELNQIQELEHFLQLNKGSHDQGLICPLSQFKVNDQAVTIHPDPFMSLKLSPNTGTCKLQPDI